MKKILLFVLLITITAVSILLSLVWKNNQVIKPVSRSEIEYHFVKSVSWLESNYNDVENIHNPVLWWMIKQAATISDDDNLKNVYSTYKKQHLDTKPANLSTPMFDELYRPHMPDITLLSDLQPYQIFFFYAISCNNDLGSEPVIQKQMKPGFCSLHYLHPRCITHQLMGLRFMQRYQCGYDNVVESTINELQQDLVDELTWDFRVGDAYIQRVLMLVDSGAYNSVKPVWIKNILSSQNMDGSWDDLDPIMHIGKDRVLAFTSMLPKVQMIKADFHATAQAIWLLSLLLEESGSH
ncbi:MAG: hypothetical protein LJE83_06840 [Gammaproteobacteria bacterium]|jgi:hypothetical protein|nr:hypothetical protein [Gammaproteobacteria bacterium]